MMRQRVRESRPVMHVLVVVVVLVSMSLVPSMVWATAADGEGLAYLKDAEKVGSETCLGCHETYGDKKHMGLHGLSAGASKTDVSCESCHGPGSLHADSEDVAKIIHPKRYNKAMDKNCQACHADVLKGWKGEKIDAAQMVCTDCHKMHQPATKGTLLTSETKLCASCHSTVAAQTRLPSHHPVKEGKMSCSTCHDFTGTKLFEKERVNDTCLECHSRYRGPFVFEHAPVAENCAVCHDPHGTVANNLLKQNEPFLCLSCHQMHFHTQLPGYVGEFSSPLHTDRGGYSTLDGFKKSMLTKCTQCHSSVHGSDMPSQSISGSGKSLTR